MAAIPVTGPVADFCACCPPTSCQDCPACTNCFIGAEDIECVECNQDAFNTHLGCTDPDPCYDARYDMDGDGDVDFTDLGLYQTACSGCL